jgi:quinoprotein glucose dehydrogenase
MKILSLVLLAVACHLSAFAAETKLQVKKWSGEINVPDPIAVSLDPQGRAYVTQTTRRKVADLDIREHPQWVPADVAMGDIEQKKAFYHDVLAPGKFLRPEGGLMDHNKDGSIDWKDLTVHTERIYQLSDTDGDGFADNKTVYAEGFNTEVTGIAAGVLWHDGYVYATIAPDVWRLRDADGDGVAEERESIVHGFGHHIAYAGHDMHGLCIGLDGRIYWTIGDKGVNVKTKDGRQVAAPHQGCVLRCEPDGSGFEIFAHGLRNVQEIAFDDYGNIFGVDNDADKPGEKERVVYITEQSDSGWRCGYQYMKKYCPWMDEGLWKPRFAGQPEYITPPLATANNGPAGFARNPGTALSPAWKDAFFYTQFPDGRLNVVRFEPRGAGFKVKEDRTVASGVMGVGLSWSADGKLFLADWGGDYPINDIGAVWSVDDATGEINPARLETKKLLQGDFAKETPARLVALLSHADQRVRREAQFALVKQAEFTVLAAVAQDAKKPRLARVHALWGIGQGLRSGKAKAESVASLLADKDSEVRAQTAKILGDAPSCAPMSAALLPLLQDAIPRVRFHAAIAVGKLKTAGAVAPLTKLLALNTDKDASLRHAGVTGLVGCATAEELASNIKHPSRAVRLASVLALRRLAAPAVQSYLADADDGIASEAARAIHDDASIMEALPALAAVLDEKKTRPEAITRRALNAAFRLGDATNALRVMKFALRADALAPLREEALLLAQTWTKPDSLDRVDGRARKFDSRAVEVIAQAALPRMPELMALKDAKLKALAIQLLTTYQLPVSATIAAAAVMEKIAAPEVRAAALGLLASQHPGTPELMSCLQTLLTQPAPEILRAAALQEQLKADPALAVERAQPLLNTGTTLEKQTALLVLAKSGSESGDATLLQWMEQMAQGKVAPALQLDLLEAVALRGALVPDLQQKLTAYETPRLALAGTAAAFSECLEGGDRKAGEEIALRNLSANCTACHRFDKAAGSNVGPALDKIGGSKDHAYLLEALVAPTAKIAPGYGTIMVNLKSGAVVSGSLVSGDAKELKVRLADATVQVIPHAEIAAKTEPISMMPPMGSLLTKRQVRDVVAYLSSLKPAATKPKKAEH